MKTNGWNTYETWYVMAHYLGNIEFEKAITANYLRIMVSHHMNRGIATDVLTEKAVSMFIAKVDFDEMANIINSEIELEHED